MNRPGAKTGWIGMLAALVLGLLLAGCRSKNEAPVAVARFFLEAQEGMPAIPLTLPVSGVTVAVEAKPVLSEYDIVNAEVVRVELGDCLLLQLTGAAARDLHRLTGGAQGRRLVLTVDGKPFGARRIDRPIDNGIVMIFVELKDEALPALVKELKSTALRVQRES